MRKFSGIYVCLDEIINSFTFHLQCVCASHSNLAGYSSTGVQDLFTEVDLASIYVVNKRADPLAAEAIRFGLARMEAVKIRWFDMQKDVK